MLDLTVLTPSPALSRTSVIDVVDHIGVVTRTAHERVRALAPVERVVPRSAVQGVVGTVANDDVVQLVAGGAARHAGIARVRVRAGVGWVDVVVQRQVLEVRAEHVAVEAGAHGVRALVGVLDDGVAGVVHHVDVVAGAADQRIGARTTVAPTRFCPLSAPLPSSSSLIVVSAFWSNSGR